VGRVKDLSAPRVLLYIITTTNTTFNNNTIIMRAYQTCFYSIRAGDFTQPEFIGTSEDFPNMQVYVFRAAFSQV
jgi:hypothetical protein